MTTRQYISAALLSGAMFMCGFGSHAIYATNHTQTSVETTDNDYQRDNSFISLMQVVAWDEPSLWAKVEASPEWEAFAAAYDRGDGSKEAKAVWEYLCEQDTSGYVVDCLSGCDAYTEWMESY